MLRINTITLTDFAPFKGEQRISFRPEPGVTLITGNNGRGKTWLLNAIRYALFGHVLGRTDGPRDLSRVANWESSSVSGHAAFKVVLEFNYDGTPYRLTRKFDPASGGPSEEVLMVRGTTTLNQEDTYRELDRVLPEQIARFFLFDGELLRQYEELAVDPTRGDELKAAIERILGIPILANARTDIIEIIGRVNRALAQAAAANVQTQQLGANLQAAQDLFDQYRDTSEELARSLESLEREKSDLEEQMARSSRAQSVMARRDALRDERDQYQRELEQAQVELEQRASSAWRAMATPALERLVQELDSELGALSERRRNAEAAVLIADQRQRARATGTCPVCGHAVDDALGSDGHFEDGDPQELSLRIAALQSRRDNLAAAVDSSGFDRLSDLEARADRLRVQIADLNTRMLEMQDELENAPEDELRDLALRFSNVQLSHENTRLRKEDIDTNLGVQEAAVRQLRERLARASGLDQAKLQRKADMLQALSELFRDGISHYRERLRAEVEEEATRIFRLLRTEPDYDRLEINDGYGLTIVHRDGEPILDRSAGYEHLVALSLLGALQRCAPITGPVIMDSQFGRLDPDHKARVVAALPEIADQVILLAYNNEFDRDQAAQALGPRLLAEKELTRVTARHTTVSDRGTVS